MQKLAESRSGRCISTEYINQKTKLEWECAKGHRWYAASNHIMEGHWCPKCAFEGLGKVKRLDCDFVNKKIEAMGGKWISGEYLNSSSKLLIECKNGHVWTAYFKHIRYGHWCPTCAGKKKYTIEDMHKLATEKGGKCLSKEYTNHDAKLRWRCRNGHEWESTPHNIIFKHWCPICLHPNAKYRQQNRH